MNEFYAAAMFFAGYAFHALATWFMKHYQSGPAPEIKYLYEYYDTHRTTMVQVFTTNDLIEHVQIAQRNDSFSPWESPIKVKELD